MKKLFAAVILILCAVPTFAQDELSLSVGAAVPTGDFANTSGGSAKTGFLADLMYQHQTAEKSKLWFAGAFRYQSNSIDNSQFQQAAPGANVSSTNWSAFSVLLGPVIKLDISETASFEPRVLVGYLSGKSPAVTISSGGASGSLPSSSGGAFATMLGANFKFKMSDNTKFILGFDYLTANPKFSISGGGTSQDVNQQISSFNVSLGLSFKL